MFEIIERFHDQLLDNYEFTSVCVEEIFYDDILKELFEEANPISGLRGCNVENGDTSNLFNLAALQSPIICYRYRNHFRVVAGVFTLNMIRKGIAQRHVHSDYKVPDVDISLLWRVIRRLGEGIKIEEVSEGLNVRQSVVEKILAMDKECSTLAYQQSKYSLQPLLNYQKLNRGNIDTLQKLIIRFEQVKETDEFKKLDLAHIPTIVSAFVGAKDGLIRTCHPQAALTLIRLFKLLKIPTDNIKVKWYFPCEQNIFSDTLLSYLEHFNFWQESITKHCGYRGLKVEFIAPHMVRGLIFIVR
ncbi:hypothetical protein [Photobacterium leiognathi]|uniref:hypothetical protein n=1 Tax=Photobacterium leiognathi TaxID=553611 RepID=UPI003DA021F9